MAAPLLPRVARRALIRQAMRSSDEEAAELVRLACPHLPEGDRVMGYALARGAWTRGQKYSANVLTEDLLSADDDARKASEGTAPDAP